MSDQQATDEQNLGPIGLTTWSKVAAVPTAPTPDETWPLPGGTAWVYRGQNNPGLVRPVLLADGFDSGPSDVNRFWDGLENHRFPFVSQLRARGKDVILLGFDDRSAAVQKNSDVVMAAIMRATAERLGSERLAVGGFSMGGLVARYALARMEAMRMDHQTGVYLSYDTPHGGASVPIALQAFAHYGSPAFSAQMNSPAARQLLWRHIATEDEVPAVDTLRTELLADLAKVGGWPRLPRLLAVANGAGDGVGNGVPAGTAALKVTGPLFKGTNLYTQSSGADALVAELRAVIGKPKDITTSGFPEIDGAPGGTLESFGILGDVLNERGAAEIIHRSINFVPTLSALGFGEIADAGDLHVVVDNLEPETSQFDDYLASESNMPHCAITPEFAEWIMDRL